MIYPIVYFLWFITIFVEFVNLSEFSYPPIFILKRIFLYVLLKAYGLAIWEWLFGMGQILAKLLQKLSPSQKTTFTRKLCLFHWIIITKNNKLFCLKSSYFQQILNDCVFNCFGLQHYLGCSCKSFAKIVPFPKSHSQIARP